MLDPQVPSAPALSVLDLSPVGEALGALAHGTKADELMVTAGIHDHAERKRSYDRILGSLHTEWR